jgi:hypothetical protein
MEIKLEIPEYSTENGLKTDWENGFIIKTKIEHGAINLIANKEGLISLAKQLLYLAQENVPLNHHIHLDEFNSLEEGSVELVIQKCK